MAKRHTIQPGSWESIVERLQEIMMANSGEDEFEETFKLMIAKLFSERSSKHRSCFARKEIPARTAESVNQLLASASDKWRGIFPSPPKSKLTNEHLEVCVQLLAQYNLSDTTLEVMDSIFESLVSKTSKGSKGQYFTPRHVIECCVRILAPKPSESVLDPACGSGGFLIHALDFIKKSSPQIDISEYCNKHIWGFDFERKAIQVAKALMLIAGDGNANLFQLNSLVWGNSKTITTDFDRQPQNEVPILTIEDVIRSRQRNFKGFDIVLTNPPFAGEIREQGILSEYQLNRKGRRMERDVLFLERCIRLLRPGGRIGIVIPHNKLGGKNWSYLREWVLKQLRIICVLGLPRNTFLPHTHQKTSVIFGMRRSSGERRSPNESVLFIVSEKSGKDSTGRIITKGDFTSKERLWLRADHDFEEVVSVVSKHIESSHAIKEETK